VAARGPARAVTEVVGVVFLADENEARAGRARGDDLGMAAQAEIIVGLDEHFFVHRTVRLMADNAPFAQGGMLKDKGPGFLAMTLGAGFVPAGKRESARGFHDVHAVRVMALDAVHLAFHNGVMLREVELRMRFEVAREAGFGVAAGIDDEFVVTAAGGDVFAAGTVAGFATLFTGEAGLFEMQARVRAGREGAGDGGMAIGANAVADERGAFDGGRSHDSAGECGAGVEEKNRRGNAQGERQPRQRAQELHVRPPRRKNNANPRIARV
jgi:hypothetical protein